MKKAPQQSHAILDALLGVYSSYLESELLGNERDDLTEQEEEEIEAQCQRLRKACLSE